MTTLLAMDQSTTNSGWCFAGNKIPLSDWTYGKFTAPKRDEEGERLVIIEDSILELIDRYQPDLLVYEQTVAGSAMNFKKMRNGQEVDVRFNADTMEKLQRVKGAVMMAAARRGMATEAHRAQSWHTSFNLPRSKPASVPQNKWKSRLIKLQLEVLGFRPETLDAVDAIGIAYYALHGKPGVARMNGDLLALAGAPL